MINDQMQLLAKIFILTHQVQPCFTAKKHDRAKCSVDYIKIMLYFIETK